MEKLYKKIILGASKEGLDYIANLQDKTDTCLVSRHTVDNVNDVDQVVGEVKFISYKKGMIILELENEIPEYEKSRAALGKNILCCLSLIIATGTKHKTPIKYHYETNIFNDNPEKQVVIIGNTDEAAQLAIDYAKEVKQVYLLASDFKMKFTNSNRLKVSNKKNIQWLPNSNVVKIKYINEEIGFEVQLDNQQLIKCDLVAEVSERIPDVPDHHRDMFEVDEAGYIITDKDNKTTRLPNIIAIGKCSKVYEKD